MRIVAINRFYRPDHSATAQLLTDLAQHLAARGAEVHVITSRSLYEGGGQLAARELLSRVHVHRVWTTRFGREWLPGRMCDYATFYLCAFAALVRTVRRGDVLIAKTDPPLISVLAALAAKLKGAVLVNWCQDVFPEVAAALGFKWAARWPGAILRRLRNWSLKAARLNVALHERMAEEMVRAGIRKEGLVVVPNWADREIRPVPRQENTKRSEWGLQDRVVIGYSGNLGRAHMQDKIAEIVKATSDIPGLTWLFIGSGHGMDAVRVATAGAKNVLFKPYQPREELSASLSAADIHLVSLDPACEGLIVPSKLYGALAAGRPVLFLGDEDGAVARDIHRLNAGWVLDPDRPQTWRSMVALALEQRAEKTPANTEKQRLGAVPASLVKWSETLRPWIGGGAVLPSSETAPLANPVDPIKPSSADDSLLRSAETNLANAGGPAHGRRPGD